MTRELPLNPIWESIGAQFRSEKDWRTPLRFAGLNKEYTAVRKGVGLMDFSFRGKIQATGNDRISFLHSILTNDIKNLESGGGCYAALLSAKGRVLMDMNVHVFSGSVLLDVEIGMEKKALELLDKHLIAEDITLQDVTDQYAMISIQGPRSEKLAKALFADSLHAIPESWHLNLKVGDTDAALINLSHTGEKGYDILIAKDRASKITEQVLQMGKNDGIVPVGSEASEILRIEAGILRYGIDMDDTVTLSETGLDAVAASETKGCYPGQEVVARTKTYEGLNKKMMGLLMAGESVPNSGDKICSGDQEIGRVTSACYSPHMDKGIALGYLRKGFYDPSTKVKIIFGISGISAIPHPLPFIKTKLPRD